MIRFDKNSYALRILLTIALSGEYPFNFLEPIGNKVIAQRTIRKLKEEKYVTVSGNGEMKTIRLTRKAIDLLKEIDENNEDGYNGYYEHYMSVSNNHHFRAGVYKNDDVGKRQTLRRHRLAETMWLLSSVDAEIWPGCKSELSLKDRDYRIEPDETCFYTSIEMKNLDIDQKYKTEFTRILGTLFSPGGIYCIYNTNKGKMKWNNQGEQKAKILVEDIVSMNYDYSQGEPPSEINNSIIIGKDIDLINSILTPNDGKRDSNGFELLSFNNTYDNIYYITLDDKGYIQLFLITRKNWKQRLKDAILPEDVSDYNTAYLTVDCDAYDKEKETFYLIFHDGNIARLRRFKEAIYGSNKKFKIFCFEFQKEAVSKYMEGMAEIEVINLEDFVSYF